MKNPERDWCVMSQWTLRLACAMVATLGAVGQAQESGPHVGSVEQALVGIEVVNTAKDGATRQARRGNGFVLRCDGFIIAPAALFSRTIVVAGQSEETESQSIVVVLNPGTPRERRVAGRRPRFVPRDIGYAVMKLDGLHAPALRTLLPDTLKADAAIQVVSSDWETSGRFRPLQRQEIRLAASPAGDSEAGTGTIELAQPIESIPAGAVIVGPDGLAVGMIPGFGMRAGSTAFVSFAQLHRATNCVTALSGPDSAAPAEAGNQDSNQPAPPMVQVPGERVLMPLAAVGEQPDMEGDLLACVAPFKIDRFEVTNEEYLAYWRTLPRENQRSLGFRSNYYPWTWAPYPAQSPFPADIARLPVLGVALAGAIGYAKWKGKRLPTPYEWCLAAFGPKGDVLMPEWARQYIGERQTAWNKIRETHTQYLNQHRELTQRGSLLAGPYKLPWIAQTAFTQEASVWSKQAVKFFLDPLLGMWRNPLLVLPVGSREYDVSPYGAMDMLLNASELVMPYPGAPTLGSARYMEIQWVRPRPTVADQWMPRQIDALTDGRPLQPLSRLYRRALIGPTADELMMWSNLNETVQMLGPLAGARLVMTGDAKSNAVMWPRGGNPYGALGRPAGFQVWDGMPEDYRTEMGRDVPLGNPDAHATTGPQLFYYLPAGFRCAR